MNLCFRALKSLAHTWTQKSACTWTASQSRKWTRKVYLRLKPFSSCRPQSGWFQVPCGPQATGKIMHTVTERSGFPDMSSGYVTLLPGSFRCLDADVTRMKLGYQHSETVKKAVHSSDVICFSGIKDSGRALLLRLMRVFLSLLCSLERDYTGFSTDLPLSLCKTTKLWQVQGLGGGVRPIVAGLRQVCKTGTQYDELLGLSFKGTFLLASQWDINGISVISSLFSCFVS